MEFALVLPLLVMLVFGIIGFGVVFAQKLALGNGAREAARLGVVERSTCEDITVAAQSAANTIAMTGTDTVVTVSRTDGVSPCSLPGAKPCQGSEPNVELTVRVDYDSELTIPLVFSNPVFKVSGEGVFRCEFS